MPLLPFSSAPSKGGASPLTTKGDLFGFSSANARLPVGTNGFVLQGDSAQTLGVGYSTRDANFNAFNAVNMAKVIVGTSTIPTAHAATISDGSSVSVSTNVGASGGGIFQWDMGPTTYTVTSAQGFTNSALLSMSPTWTLSGNVFIMSGIVMSPTFNGTTPPSASARWVDITPQLSTTGTWPEVVSVYTNPTFSGAGVTATNYYGLRVGSTLSGGAAITTCIGVDVGVASALAGTTIWAMQVGNYNSYFQGKTAHGGTSTPANTIDIQGGVINGKLDTMTYTATISLNVAAGQIHETTTINSVGGATINASSGGTAGQWMWVIINNDATSGKAINFGTNFRAGSAISGVPSKAGTICFISDGTSWFECGRATGV